MDLSALVETQVDALIRLALDSHAVERDPHAARELQSWCDDNRSLVDAALGQRIERVRKPLVALRKQLKDKIEQDPFYRTVVRGDSRTSITEPIVDVRAARQTYLSLRAELQQTEADLRKVEAIAPRVSAVKARINEAIDKHLRYEQERRDEALRLVKEAARQYGFPATRSLWARYADVLPIDAARSICAAEICGAIQTLLRGNQIQVYRRSNERWEIVNPRHLRPEGGDSVVRSRVSIVPPASLSDWQPWIDGVSDQEHSIRSLFDLRDELILYCRQQAETHAEWTRRLRGAFDALWDVKVVTFSAPQLSEDDYRLCSLWMGPHSKSEPYVDAKSRLFSRNAYDAARLISARVAERVAMQFYESDATSVEDVSMTQLTGSGEEWRQFDLLVGGRPIDVKNSRKSFSSPATYTEHCVPRHKLCRSSHSSDRGEISFAGVLSDYLTAESTAIGETAQVELLGEVRRSEIEALTRWVQTAFDGRLRLQRLRDHGFLPGWIFEYEEDVYLHRQEKLLHLQQEIDRARSVGYVPPEELDSLGLLAVHDDRAGRHVAAWSKAERRIIEQLRQMKLSIGISRRSLFALSLGQLLNAVLHGTEAEEAASLRSVLFHIGDTSNTRPLGLLDTRGYIGNLIDLMERAGPCIRDSIPNMKYFELTHPQVLRGVGEDDRSITVYAYCGGRRILADGKSVACGRDPIFLGMTFTCTHPGCGHLVCPDCGFCSVLCEGCAPRQKSWRADN